MHIFHAKTQQDLSPARPSDSSFILHLLHEPSYGSHCSLQSDSRAEILATPVPPNVTLFEDKLFKEAVKLE